MPLKTLPITETVLWGVRIIIPPRGHGENFPKFSCDVSLAEKTGIISAKT